MCWKWKGRVRMGSVCVGLGEEGNGEEGDGGVMAVEKNGVSEDQVQ